MREWKKRGIKGEKEIRTKKKEEEKKKFEGQKEMEEV